MGLGGGVTSGTVRGHLVGVDGGGQLVGGCVCVCGGGGGYSECEWGDFIFCGVGY